MSFNKMKDVSLMMQLPVKQKKKPDLLQQLIKHDRNR